MWYFNINFPWSSLLLRVRLGTILIIPSGRLFFVYLEHCANGGIKICTTMDLYGSSLPSPIVCD